MGNLRVTVLTETVLRIEWSASGRFEGRPSLALGERHGRACEFSVEQRGAEARLTTAALTLTWRDDGLAPHAGNLSVHGRVGGREILWRPGDRDNGNLGGTTRTLDNVSGRVPLDSGLLSRAGWTLIDDSRSLVLDATIEPAAGGRGVPERTSVAPFPWIAQRTDPGAIDWYFFAYGDDYPAALQDFAAVAGRAPLPPRYVFGAWWSRYWAYSDAELRSLVGEFRTHGVPLDVLVIDMDWHLDGWTGYSWNPEYFPDPTGFLAWAHSEGLRIALNLHPADGVGRHEAAFADVCRDLELDSGTTERVLFDCTDPRFVDSYFRRLHHPLEKQGVDFWWMDWQQGAQTRVPGLDPLSWLNYLHWTDWERDAGAKHERPLIFSRWGGLGNHRYPIGFSGDTYCDWRSLAFQPEFTATAGNVGYGYWSHDIGGHQPGPVEPELYVRWLQWGAMSPILRTHTTKRADAERRIWAIEPHIFAAARKAWLLRYALLPYIYSAARQCYEALLPLCRPLYYEWPQCEEAYARLDEYMFGDDLLIAPVTEPATLETGVACVRVWLPPGRWRNWFSGRLYAGPGDACLRVRLDEIPIFAREGAVIPLSRAQQAGVANAAQELSLLVFPAERESEFETRVYEDDGLSRGYERGEFSWTKIRCRCQAGVVQLTIGPAEGDFAGMARERSFEIAMCPGFEILAARLDGCSITTDGQRVSLPRGDVRLARNVELEIREISIEPQALCPEDLFLRLELRGAAELGSPALDVFADAVVSPQILGSRKEDLSLDVRADDTRLEMSATQMMTEAGGDVRLHARGRWRLQYPLQTMHLAAEAAVGDVRVTARRCIFPGVNRWYVRGPFNEDDIAVESRALSSLGVNELRANAGGWDILDRPLDAGAEPLERFAPDFATLFGDTAEPFVFAAAILDVPAAASVRFRIQSSDAVTAWLNGSMLYEYVSGRPWAVLHDYVACELRAGLNLVLLQVKRGWLGWSCGLEIETPEGEPRVDIRAS